VWWEILHGFGRKYTCLSSTKRILEISQNLTKLPPWVIWNVFWDPACIHSHVWFRKHFKLYTTFLSSLCKYLHCCISCITSIGGALDMNSTVGEALNNYWLGNCNHNSNNDSNRDQLNIDFSQTDNENNITVSTKVINIFQSVHCVYKPYNFFYRQCLNFTDHHRFRYSAISQIFVIVFISSTKISKLQKQLLSSSLWQ